MLDIVIAELPLFWTTIDLGALGTLVGSLPNARVDGVNVSVEVVPLRVTTSGLFGALLTIVRFAVRVPIATGAKVTLMLHC